MAEGGVQEGVIGEEEGAGGAPGETSAAALDPAAAALAMRLVATDARLASAATNYFRKQTHLVVAQTEHLDEQRAAVLSQLKLRVFIDRMKAATQVFIAMIAAVISVGVLAMIYAAFSSNSVVVEPFNAPPALAPSGLSGTVVAAAVLDKLTTLQAASRDVVAKRNLSNAWTGDIKIELPQTGVSIGDFERFLKQEFGHDVHVSGDLTQSPDGRLALTVRGDGVPPRTFPDKPDGPDGLDALATEAAEYVYGQSEPSLYATYLITQDRNLDAVRFAERMAGADERADRPYLLNQWANAVENISVDDWTRGIDMGGLGKSGDKTQVALALYRKALALKPDYWRANDNVQMTLWMTGQEQNAWRQGTDMMTAAGGRRGRAPDIAYNAWDQLTWNLQAWRDALNADVEGHAGVGSETSAEAPVVAAIDLRLHDLAGADLERIAFQRNPTSPTTDAMIDFVEGQRAAAVGDTARARTYMEAFGKDFANPAVSSNFPGYDCWIGPAEAAAGQRALAYAALQAGGRFVDCYRFRGDLFDGPGQWNAAEKNYLAAIALAPDLPAGHYSFGLALARHGMTPDAIAQLKQAHTLAPHWADPLAALGDVLATKGQWRAALASYDEALRYAPAWIELRNRRAAAQKRVG